MQAYPGVLGHWATEVEALTDLGYRASFRPAWYNSVRPCVKTKQMKKTKTKRKGNPRSHQNPKTLTRIQVHHQAQINLKQNPNHNQTKGRRRNKRKKRRKRRKKTKAMGDRAKHDLQCDLPIRYKPCLPSPQCIMVIKFIPSRHLHFLLFWGLPLLHLPAAIFIFQILLY